VAIGSNVTSIGPPPSTIFVNFCILLAVINDAVKYGNILKSNCTLALIADFVSNQAKLFFVVE